MSSETDWRPLRDDTPWPNQKPIIDGVISTDEVPQNADFHGDSDEDLEKVFGV